VGRLPAGAYLCDWDEVGNGVLQRHALAVDELIDFSGSLAAQLLDEIEHFWTLGERFRKYGFLHRRGYLLHGKQGSGKSSLVHLVISRAVARDNVAFFCEQPAAFAQCVSQFRTVEPERPILCIFEDIDALIHSFGDGLLLQWLDGNLQVDKAISLATTNFPEKLDRRITARPRRFDRLLRIDSPDEHLRDAYFARKLPELTTTQRRPWVEASQGLSFAGLAELIISVCCLEKDLAEMAALLKELDKHQPASAEHRKSAARDGKRSRIGREDWDEIPF
jgi:SpoVK/Ycf46/Vps4 family AAA+-type ATPase